MINTMINTLEIQQIKNNVVICLENVHVAYGGLVAIAGIYLDIHKGEIVGICGPNGSGKTTLLKAILGQVKPYQGSIKIFDHNVTNGNISKDLKMLVGYVPQAQKIDHHFPALVEDVVMMGRYAKIGLGRRPTNKDWNVVNKALKDVHLEKFAKRPIGHLSGGQQQKVMIARALAQEPQILLLDEPTSALDFKIAEELMNLIKELHDKQNLTIIMVQHNIKILQEYSDRLICLNVKLAFDGKPDDPNINEVINKVFFT
ncbi:MAG: metal ABC transporter ATP-binding protein [Candidatus Thorarchaeota archaeon]